MRSQNKQPFETLCKNVQLARCAFRLVLTNDTRGRQHNSGERIRTGPSELSSHGACVHTGLDRAELSELLEKGSRDFERYLLHKLGTIFTRHSKDVGSLHLDPTFEQHCFYSFILSLGPYAVTMSLLGSDINFNDDFYIDFDSPMFALVDPNEICPAEVLSETHQYENAVNIANHCNCPSNSHERVPNYQQVSLCTASTCQTYEPLVSQQTQESQTEKVLQIQHPISYEHQHYELIEQQSTLPTGDELERSNANQLDTPQALVQQRKPRPRIHLTRQPPQPILPLVRKNSNKKMTGRERQLELERQEAYQLQLREHYLYQIKQLEERCNKLREILGNIVTSSPEYNNHVIEFLETTSSGQVQSQNNYLSC